MLPLVAGKLNSNCTAAAGVTERTWAHASPANASRIRPVPEKRLLFFINLYSVRQPCKSQALWGQAFSLPPGFCPAPRYNREERRLKAGGRLESLTPHGHVLPPPSSEFAYN